MNDPANPQYHVESSFTFIGDVGSGKSTTAGHLACKHGYISESDLQHIEKKANEVGKGSLKYAWIMDTLDAERQRGQTIEISVAHYLDDKKSFNLIDTPGHKDFIESMLDGISLGNCVILVISAAPGEFEAGVEVDGKTKELILLGLSVCTGRLIVAVNKIDQTEPPYSKDRFYEIVDSVSEYIKTIGYNPKDIPFVPISGFKDDNLDRQSDHTRWFTGWEIDGRGGFSSGVTLTEAIEAIEAIETPEIKGNGPKLSSMPLRISVHKVTTTPGGQETITGQVKSGELVNQGAKKILTFAPGSLTAELDMIESRDTETTNAAFGQIINFRVKDKSVKDISGGHVVGDSKNDPPKGVKSFSAKIKIVGNLVDIQVGYNGMVDCQTAHVACEFVDLIAKADPRTGRKLEDNPRAIKTGDLAMVKLKPTKPMCVEPFTSNQLLGRIIVRDKNQILAFGTVLATEKETG